MTNEQLVILLTKYRDALSDAVMAVQKELPDEFTVGKKNILGQDEIEYPILRPINDIVEMLDDDIETLSEGRA